MSLIVFGVNTVGAKGLAFLMLIFGIIFMILYVLEKNTNNVFRALHKSTLKNSNNSNRVIISPSANIRTNPFQTMIDRVYFINMDHRTDRLDDIMEELERVGVPPAKIKRIPGVKDKYPALGCSKAHLEALLDCKTNGYRTCIVLEDDFVFKDEKPGVWSQLNWLVASHVEWDMILLARNANLWEHTNFDPLVRIVAAQTTGGYMVHANFLDVLIDNVRNGIAELDKGYDPDLCIDQYWKLIQKQNKWYTFHPRMGHQRNSFSDIQNTVTDYPDKTELFADNPAPLDFLVCVQTCHIRDGKYDALLASLRKLPPSMAFYTYKGDPLLPTEYSIHERDKVITLQCKDDYLNLCHKFGQLLSALKNTIELNPRFQKLKGVLFLDDDVSIVGCSSETKDVSFGTKDSSSETKDGPQNVFTFLDRYLEHPYFGVVTSLDYSTNFLKRKAKESRTVHSQIESAYPGLLQYDMGVHAGEYCAGPAFFVRMDALPALWNTTTMFLPFPARIDKYLMVTDDGQKFYSNQICVMEDSNIGATLRQAGFPPTNVPMHDIIVWK